MARKTNKQKAQELVDEAERLFLEAKSPKEKKAWAEDTLSNMDEAIKLDSKNAFAWNSRGVAKNELGDHLGAIDDCAKAIELNSEYPNPWINMGVAKDALGDQQGAIADYTKAIELEPEDVVAWSNRGLAKKQLGDHHGAIDDCAKAIEINPKYALAWNYRGATKNELGDHQGAIVDFSEAIRLDPKISPAWNGRGFAKNALGDHHGALSDFTEGLKLDPNAAPAWNNRGFAKNALGKYQDAIDDYTKAIELNPHTASTWLNRGIAKRHLGKYDDAIKDSNEAQKLEPNNIYIRQFRLEAENAELRNTTEKYKGEYRTQMKKELIGLRRALLFYRGVRIVLFVFLFELIIAYWFGASFILSGLLDLSNFAIALNKISNPDFSPFSHFLSIISRVSILSIIIFPVVWAIRLLNMGINRAEILKWDLFSRNNVDNSIEYYHGALGNNRNDIIVAYMNDWINSNPADRLVTLQRKKSNAKKQPENESLLQEIKNLLEQLTKRDKSED